MRSVLRLLPLVVIAAVMATPADASVVRRMSIEDLARTSVTAVDGTVTEKRVVLGKSKGQVWTRYRLKVHTTLVGETAPTLTFHVAGGRIGNLSQELHGSASLEREQRAVVFLWKDSDGRLRVLGQSQGVFTVKRDKRNRLVCRNAVEDLVLVDDAKRPVKAEPKWLALDALKARVQAERDRLEALRRAALERRKRELEERRVAAERNAERLRGRPGAPR